VTAAGARAALSAESSRVLTTTGGGTVGQVTLKEDVAITPTLRGGGLALLTVQASGSLSFWPSGTGASCGANGTVIANATPWMSSHTVQPVAGAGWLTLRVANRARSVTRIKLTVWTAAGTASTFVPDRDIATDQTIRAYLPAGGLVDLWTSAGGGASAKAPLTKVQTTSWTTSLRGDVIGVGVATGAQRGALFPRRSVTLPAAVSCARHTARIAVTKVGRKKARKVVVVVNGKKVRTLSRLKVKGYGVKVPAKGTITLKAKVTSRHGTTRTTARTYAACR
jgi:hypothetical protein